jgi:predicted enzyme related to lactoylglutathione lyase
MTALEFLYLPVPELAPALAFYRDELGWEEGWREGETTVALAMPGSAVQLMVDVDAEGRSGPVFVVDDVRAWITARRDTIDVWLEPNEIPGGWWAGFSDPFGNPVYVLDQSAENPG